MLKRQVLGLFLLLAVGVVGALSVTAGPPVFGLGGSLAGVLSTEETAWIDEIGIDGIPPIPGVWVLSGGSGRGGSVGGWSLGGVGWETSAAVTSIDGAVSVRAEAGFGGLDVGAVFAGDHRSFLTAGAVIGGGASGLTLMLAGDEGEVLPNGIDIEPNVFVSTSAFLSAAPYLSMQVQPLRFLGFELRLGYLFELASVHWHDESATVGLPELQFAGPWVTLGVSWGWVSRGETVRSPSVERIETISVPATEGALVVENPIGEVVIRFADEGDGQQTGSHRAIRGTATVNAPADLIDGIGVEISIDGDRVVLRSRTPERAAGWRVDYDLTVPAGTPLELDLGVGDVQIDRLTGRGDVRTGVGALSIGGASGESLVISVGVGSVTIGKLSTVEASVSVDSGIADIGLAPDASVDIAATVGLGDVQIGGFAEMTGAAQGALGRDLRATIGEPPARQRLAARVGLGQILIREADRGVDDAN